jgi:L,D-transpeptidase YcbB
VKAFVQPRYGALVGSIARGAIALAVASALNATGGLAADGETGQAFMPVPPAPVAAYANRDLGQLINSAPELVVAGERLNAGLLRRFYARHGFAPVWTTRQVEANSLMTAVLRAGEQGLAPELFHANLLRSIATLLPLDRELLLSDAFLAYADALARGAMPIERRRDDETLTPQPIDIAAALDTAIGSRDRQQPSKRWRRRPRPTCTCVRLCRLYRQAVRPRRAAGARSR